MQTVVRALRVLTAVSSASKGISLQSLSRQLDIPIASTHRLLGLLVEHQFIVRSEATRRYFLGPAARELADAETSLPGTPNVVHPALTRIAAETGETAFVTEFVGNRALCVSLAEGRHPLRLFVRIGQEMPLHAAASARVLLSDLPEGQALSLLNATSMTAFTTETPTTVDQVMDSLSRIRTRGYDVCDNELDGGVWAVAAPIRRVTGQVCAAVTVAAPAPRVRDATARFTALVLAAADRIAVDLGWSNENRPDTRPHEESASSHIWRPTAS